MPVLKNLIATVHSGVAGPLITVSGDANQKDSSGKAELKKRVPQGINPSILLLDLENAEEKIPENWQKVSFNENVKHANQYEKVSVMVGSTTIETIEVKKQ